MRNLWVILSSTGIALQLLLIRVVVRNALRRFPVLFVYAVALFLTTMAEASAFYNADFFARANRYYWVIDAARQGLIFVLVISLIYGAMDRSEKRAVVRRALIASAFLFVCVSLYFTWDARPSRWMTQLSRDLGFLAVILNLILWAVLIQSRRADRTLLMISGGMGIQMAGKAIGHSLRQLSRSTIVPGDLIIVLSHLLCLYIWWQAFRHFDQNAPRNTIS
jgi:hypothetical protein